jgi:hypothetical protein
MKKKNILFMCLLFALVTMQMYPVQLKSTPPVPRYVFTYDSSGHRITRTYVSGLQQQPKGDSVITIHDVKHTIAIFPNPTKGLFKVTITNLQKDVPAQILVQDISGRIVQTLDKISEVTDIDFKDKANGIYFLKVIIGTYVTDWKIVKEN